MAVDSRFLRTLWPFALRPGFLTGQYNAGRHARHVPPIRLYLFISFALFLTAAFIDVHMVRGGQGPGPGV